MRILAVALATLALLRESAAGELRPDVPPGVAPGDPDRARFRLGRDPLRSFEEDSEGWVIEGWEASPGLGEPSNVPARRTDSRASHGRYALVLPVEFPRATVAFKPATIGEYRYVTYDVYVPADAPGRVRSLFFLKNKDGLWFQALSTRPFVRSETGEYAPGGSSSRLVAGAWNTVTVDLRPATTDLVPHGHLARWQEALAGETQVLGFAVFGDEHYIGEVLLDNVRGWTLADEPRPPLGIANFSFAGRTRTFSLWETSLELTREFSNPFDPQEVRVDACIRAPSGTEWRVPGFLYQEYSRRLTSAGEELTPVGGAVWKVRFAPREIGEHRFRVEVDCGGEKLVTRERSFMVDGSDHPGFVRVSKRDPRCFEFDNGEPYYPIGHNFRSPNDPRCSFVLGWPLSPDEGTYTYDRILERMASSGETFVEIWMASWWVDIEWLREWKGYGGLGRYNLANAWRLDYLLRRARDLGLRVQLVIDNHGKYSTWCDAEWQYSPFNLRNAGSGGFLPRPEDFFTNDEAKRLYRQKTRYILARWGWDPTILGFEIISELDLIGSRHGFAGRRPGSDSDDAPLRTDHLWHREMIAYFRTMDPAHLFTTHYSGNYATVDPVMARMKEIDYVVGDGYRGDDAPFAHLAVATGQNHSRFGKPFMITEYGGNWNGTSEAGLEADLHSGLWGSYMTPAAGSPLLWWFDFVDRRDLYWHYRALANFARGEDRRDPELRGRSLAVERAPQEVQALAYMSRSRGYAWVYAVEPMSRYPSEPVAVEGVRVRIDDVEDGTWSVELWDTVRGEPIRSELLAASGGVLVVELPRFGNDIAMKLRRRDLLRPAAGAAVEAPQDRAPGAAPPGSAPGRSRLLGPDAREEGRACKFVRDWVLLGPFPYEAAKWEQALAIPFVEDEAKLSPRAAPAGLEWKAWPPEGRSSSDYVDLDAAFGGKESSAAYAAAELECQSEMKDLVLQFGSDDMARVYLNGKLVHEFPGQRAPAPDQDRVEGIRLRKGRNLFLVKCLDVGGGWGFYLRLETPDGRPVLVEPAGR